ncbi:uncharacterized protein LOC110632192 isoform X3 [Hevea brasiliensis]|nr:uncharacterized protein LOC110632192 isoform X3 [Hevea brasiliensis]
MARTRSQGMNETNDMEELDDTTLSSPRRPNAFHFGGGESLPEERKGSNRKRKRSKRVELDGYEAADEENANGDSLRQDPLEVLGWDLMMKILSNLDARSVALSLLVSRGWHRVASSDRLWSSKCEELWLGKAHIPRLSQVRGISKLAAYSLSVIDGKRTRIMRDDLCDHVWEFHFTKLAPEYWRNLDPYWKGTGPPMHRYFHQDGSQTADPGDRVWGGHECCFSVVTSFVGDGTIREHYVRINRWPRMSVSRKQDWSWEMSNHLFCYSSIPDASKEGGTGPLFLVMEICTFPATEQRCFRS